MESMNTVDFLAQVVTHAHLSVQLVMMETLVRRVVQATFSIQTRRHVWRANPLVALALLDTFIMLQAGLVSLVKQVDVNVQRVAF
jgi:hypothetical protein